MSGLYGGLCRAIAVGDPDKKCVSVGQLWQALNQGRLIVDSDYPLGPVRAPGRPERPELVDPSKVPRRRLGTAGGRAALVHAIAHIEFNAINLALDAAFRFRDLPEQYYHDWLSVAVDESRHFRMLSRRLEQMGFEYGDFTAHNGLWEMAEKTAGSCLERMALVPRVLEARALDVTPGMINRLKQAGDEETIAILEVILDEEIRHVEIGSRWFRYCCDRQGLDPDRTFLALLEIHFASGIRGPFNLPARFQAGFSEREMAAITHS